ncbi:MAG: hypothetical protein SVM80_00805 [Halobacteriota archaeon]|nr:hypothetical protein [Halobacteriota archaeon]
MGDGYLVSEKLQKRQDFRRTTFCTFEQPIDFQLLKELARARADGKKSLEDLCKNPKELRLLKELAEKLSQSRSEQKKKELEDKKEDLKKHEEELALNAMEFILDGGDVDELAEDMKDDEVIFEIKESISNLEKTEQITKKDIEETLKDIEEKGYIGIERGIVKITSKGANVLAKGVLREITENFRKKEVGIHETPEATYHGAKVTSITRPHEIGDDYELLAIEETLLRSLERNPSKIMLHPKDFCVYKTIHQTRMCAGLLIDKSGSMKSNGKINAAIETSLAFSELLKGNPTDTMKIFVFSDDVEQIQPWDITNIECGGWTDIRAGMKAFRKSVVGEEGDRHAYLITDTEPNYKDGECVGFEKATQDVLEEALHYREDQITLNIIMLSWTPHLREFASTLAKKNLGRVFFTSPYSLGEVILEDYLSNKKGRI